VSLVLYWDGLKARESVSYLAVAWAVPSVSRKDLSLVLWMGRPWALQKVPPWG
jgi:hypothetical protein